ncbi:MAG: NAD-binding protein, partial [Luminiphilus sp.]
MKIIILGAGQVGGTLAEQLADEQNEITVVDSQATTLRALQERLDIRTVLGDAAHPSTLLNAGAENADLLIAVTNSDEINMLACQVAFTLYRTPTKISRIRSSDYLERSRELFKNGAIPVDVIIGPEQLVTNNIEQLIANPGSLQVLDFAEG